MLKPILATFVVLFSLPALAQDAPCTSAKHREFDFWVGRWDVLNDKGELQGTNDVTRLLGGCVVQENWRGVKGSRGQSYNMYYARDDKWHQTWVDNQGTRLDLSGSFKDGVMVLGGQMPGSKGKPVLHEIRFKKLDDGRVRQHWRVSKNDGKKWDDVFVGYYTKRDEDVRAAITRTALDYAEGWYSAKPEQMERALHPELAKRRVYIQEGKDGRKWVKLDRMGAMTLVQSVRKREPDTSKELRKDVEILDIHGDVATVKLTMNHWIDYLHIAKADDRWVIVNVLWEKTD